MTRLTFVGDIALDKPLLKAAKTKGNRSGYDFSDVFHTADVFENSDFVIGNLETCFGGRNKYNNKSYHYNSPDSFCQAIKDAGINMVSTATNHCMDEGTEGVIRTLHLLDENSILHTGTFAQKTEERYLIKEINGIRIAFFSLTFSLNHCIEALSCEDLWDFVNLTGFTAKKLSMIRMKIKYHLKPEIRRYFKLIKKQSTISTHTDLFKVNQINEKWMRSITEQIHKAKENSDLLVVLLHSGGQFNIEPGEYSVYMMNKLSEMGADIVIGNHPHTIQRIERKEGKVLAYSLGGFCMSPSGQYINHECLPEYSLALHIDLSDSKKISSCKVDVLLGSENESGYLHVSKAERVPESISSRIGTDLV